MSLESDRFRVFAIDMRVVLGTGEIIFTGDPKKPHPKK
jgi:hypothetical protein